MRIAGFSVGLWGARHPNTPPAGLESRDWMTSRAAPSVAELMAQADAAGLQEGHQPYRAEKVCGAGGGGTTERKTTSDLDFDH